MKKIRATFIGKDGSLGFRNGVDYQLTVSTGKILEIRGTGEAGQVVCIYGSFTSFLSNWDNIQNITQ